MSHISVLIMWGYPVLNILRTREIKRGSERKCFMAPAYQMTYKEPADIR